MSIKIVSENRKARFNFTILDTYEAGIVLTGSEVKSLRAGSCGLQDAFVSFRGHEAYLQRAYIAPYKASSYNNHEPERLRKLLLNRHELNKIRGAVEEKGMSCIPLKVYFKNGRAKVEIALAKGKQKGDKRETIKKRDADREMSRARSAKNRSR